MKNLSLVQKGMLALIEATVDTGRIFCVTFRKRGDGSLRQMQARLNVVKGTKGVGLSFDPNDKNLLVVYEMPESQFRCIPVDGLLGVTVDKLVAIPLS